MRWRGWVGPRGSKREGREREKRRKQAKREWRIRETRREGEGRTKQTELIYRDVADPPRPSGPPRAPCSFSFLSFCYVEPAAFPAIRSIRPLSLLFEIELQEVERRCLLDAPDSSDKMQVNSLSFSLSFFLYVYRRKDEGSRPGSRSLFLDFFEYFSMDPFSVNLA